MKLPVFTWLPGYDRSWLRGDVIAGLTFWAVLVPEALAYATIAGVSPVVGLYAAPGALLLYAAFGSSRQLGVGPTAATAALSAAAVGDLAGQNRRIESGLFFANADVVRETICAKAADPKVPPSCSTQRRSPRSTSRPRIR